MTLASSASSGFTLLARHLSLKWLQESVHPPLANLYVIFGVTLMGPYSNYNAIK